MLELNRVEMIEMINDERVVEMIDKQLEDGESFEEYCKGLKEFVSLKVKWKGNNIGYLICKDTSMSGRKEVHAFFYPEQRRYTLQTLKAIVSYFKDRGWGLYTTVTGNFEYIVRVVKMTGFYVFDVTQDAVHQGGQTYPLYHLVNTFY